MEDESDNAALIREEEDSGYVDINNSNTDISSDYWWKVIAMGVNTVIVSLISVNIFVLMWFVSASTDIGAFELHILLCGIGYQFVMSHAIMSLNTHTGWSILTYRHRRRVHWALQLSGSALAIAGSVIMMKHKSVNFNTIHGKLALAALIFTCISLINGVISLYAVELRRFIPAKVSKISHIILGTAAFALSSVCLAYGYNKNRFKKWASDDFAYIMIAVVATYSGLIIAAPYLGIWKRLFRMVQNMVC